VSTACNEGGHSEATENIAPDLRRKSSNVRIWKSKGGGLYLFRNGICPGPVGSDVGHKRPSQQSCAEPSANFDGLDFANWGAGHPPDTNGDVGPTYYIQTINSSIGIFARLTGVRWPRSLSTASLMATSAPCATPTISAIL